ncbi:MAG: outer membrane protein assembly factor BamC, partial [Polynucleobacter sp.]|nr:outer membrane protein assembly factor BamC [Polynucleobacter sp.]
RLMERLGHSQEQAKAQLAASSSPTAKVVKAKLEQDSSGAAIIELPSSFDRAWRDVGLALDRSNFTVIDRDRSKGIYFVRYVNTKDSGESKGFFSGLFSSKDEAALLAKQYRIYVKANGADASQVVVQDAEGKPENTPAGLQLLTILTTQLAR